MSGRFSGSTAPAKRWKLRPADMPGRAPAVRPAAWLLAAMSLSACSTTPVEPTLQPTDPPITTLSPTDLLEPSASPNPTRSPEPTASPEPSTLHVDGMATVDAERLRQVVDPAHPGRHGRLNRRLGPLETGQRLFLVDGPRNEQGIDWWQVMRPFPLFDGPLGWVQAQGRDGPNLMLHQPPCPRTDGPFGAEQIGALTGFELLACFGDRELTLQGTVECNSAHADGGIGGAPYFNSDRHCSFEEAMPVYGDRVTAIWDTGQGAPTVSGEYQLNGHFDDPDSRLCGWIPIGVSHSSPTTPDPVPVIWCRQNFVVTSIQSLE